MTMDDWRTKARPASYPARENRIGAWEQLDADHVVERLGVSAAVAMSTPNTSNAREHWATRAKRAKMQRAKAARAFRAWARQVEILPVLLVTLTRVGSGRLDSDGVASALKSVRDGIADALRIDDASPLVRWEYRQRVGEPGVEWALEALCGRDVSGRAP